MKKQQKDELIIAAGYDLFREVCQMVKLSEDDLIAMIEKNGISLGKFMKSVFTSGYPFNSQAAADLLNRSKETLYRKLKENPALEPRRSEVKSREFTLEDILQIQKVINRS